MAVPRWSSARLAVAALAVLLVPVALAAPEVRDASEATVFVDGSVDSFEFAGGDFADVGVTWHVVAPDGASMRFVKAQPGTDVDGVSFFLDGTPRAGGTADWTAIGSLDGAAADGTWSIAVHPGFYASYDDVADVERPGPTLAVQGKGIHFGVHVLWTAGLVQTWNWHETSGTWDEPSTVPVPGPLDLPDEGPEEDPRFARFFAPSLAP